MQLRSFFSRILHSKIIGVATKIGLTLLAFWLVFRGVDFRQLGDIIRKQDRIFLLAAALLISAQTLLGGFRWHLIIAALTDRLQPAISRLEAQKLYYISIFFNCCLPGTVGGDVVRIWLAKSDRLPLPVSIHSVIIDRLLALVALGLLVIFMLPRIGERFGYNFYYLWPVIVLLAIIGIYVLIHLDRILQRYHHLRFARWLLYFMSSLKLLWAHKTASALSLLYAVLAHLCYCLCGFVLARSMGADISLLDCITFIPPVLLITTLPISIGGWGVREAAMVGLLGLAGVPQADALLLSIELGLTLVILSLPAGLLWLVYRKRSEVAAMENAPLRTI